MKLYLSRKTEVGMAVLAPKYPQPINRSQPACYHHESLKLLLLHDQVAVVAHSRSGVSMPTVAIHHVNFHVARPLLEEMKNFYCDVMGLTPGFRPELKQFGYWLYAESIPIVHLYEAVGNDLRQPGVNSVFDHVAFHCKDLKEITNRLERLNVPYAMVQLPHSGQFQIAVTDPAGHKAEFIVEP